jgi:hypothetical protein
MFNLSFSHGNGKLPKSTMIFNLPAGKTCPGADKCMAFVTLNSEGKRRVNDGPEMEFRCFAASSEALFGKVYDSRQNNFNSIKNLLKNFSVGVAGNIVADMIQSQRKKRGKNITTHVRIHESGDFFTADYFAMWMHVCRLIPDLTFYAYSKNLPMILDYGMDLLPSNFYLTASMGGKFDYLIEEGYFPRYSVVLMNQAEADARGLEVDHDETHCYTQDGPFALLVHGIQPAGSVYGKAVQLRKKNKEFVGYSR